MKLDRQKLLLLMAKSELNQKDLANKAGISRRTLSAVMNGQSCRPEQLEKITKALNVEPEQIIED